MIGDVARVGRASADIDDTNSAAIRLDQMKCRHLREAIGGCSRWRELAEAGVMRHQVARFYEGVPGGITGAHALATHMRKGIDVELIVGENNVVLKVLRIGARVVVEAV